MVIDNCFFDISLDCARPDIIFVSSFRFQVLEADETDSLARNAGGDGFICKFLEGIVPLRGL